MSTKNQKASKVLEDISGKKLTLGSYLWSIRMGEELTQADFATHLGVSRHYLCDVEHGRRFVSPKAAAEFATLLGYPIKQFVRLALQDMLSREGINLLVEVKEAA